MCLSQPQLLDINFYFPRGRQFDRIMFCVDNQHTGIMMPMEGSFGRTNDNQKDYLSLIPSIRSTFAPPFIGKTTQHMRNNYGDQKGLNNNGNKNVQLASFRILHIPDLSDGAQAVLPFIFILLQTYAQWFAQSPECVVEVSDMITSGLTLNTIVTAQKQYLLHSNKVCAPHHERYPFMHTLTFPALSFLSRTSTQLTHLIYLTYSVIMAKIIAAAFMASVSISASSGKYPKIVRHRAIVFQSLRLVAFLSCLFLVPILLTSTDPLTGQQSQYHALYSIVAVFIIVVMVIFWWRAYRQHQKDEERANVQDEEMANITKSPLPHDGWTAEQVSHWIGNSVDLRENASLTEGELEGIAAKFLEGKIKGEVFAEVSNDRESLKEVGLSLCWGGYAVCSNHE